MNPPTGLDIFHIAEPNRRVALSSDSVPNLSTGWLAFMDHARTQFSVEDWENYARPLLLRLKKFNGVPSFEKLGLCLYREARHQESMGFPQRAQSLYQLLKNAHTAEHTPTFSEKLRTKAQRRLNVLGGVGNWADRLEHAVPIFLMGVSNPVSYGGIFLGQGAYGLTRLGILSRLKQFPAHHLLRNAWFAKPLTTVGAAFVEATITTAGTQTLLAWNPGGHSEAIPFGSSVGDAFVTSLALRGSHAGARPALQSAWIQKAPQALRSNLRHGSSLLGIYGAQYFSAEQGWRAFSSTPWVDSLNTYVHMHTMGKISQSFFGHGFESHLHRLESQFTYDSAPFFEFIRTLHSWLPLGQRLAYGMPGSSSALSGQVMLMTSTKAPGKGADDVSPIPRRAVPEAEPDGEPDSDVPQPREHLPSTTWHPDARFAALAAQKSGQPIFSNRDGTKKIEGLLDLATSMLLKNRITDSCDLLLRLHRQDYNTVLWWGPVRNAVSEAHAIMLALDTILAPTPHRGHWKQTQDAYGELWHLLGKIRSQVPYYDAAALDEMAEENPELLSKHQTPSQHISNFIESLYKSQNRLMNFLDNGLEQDLIDTRAHAIESHQQIKSLFPGTDWENNRTSPPPYNIEGLSPDGQTSKFFDYIHAKPGVYELPAAHRRSVAFLGNPAELRPTLLRHQLSVLSEDPSDGITETGSLKHIPYSKPQGWVDVPLSRPVSFLEAHFLLNSLQLKSLGAENFTRGLLDKLKPGGVALVTATANEIASFNTWLDHLEQRNDLQILRGMRYADIYPTQKDSSNMPETWADEVHYVMIRKLPTPA